MERNQIASNKARYVNFFTDFGFKRLFGSEPSKEFLLDFLNELLQPQEGKIRSISYLKSEQIGRVKTDRRAVYDLYCESEKGHKFIVELQKTEQKFFKDRTVYYSTFPIIEQAKKNKWNYELQPVYVVAILDFVFDEDEDDKEKIRYDIKLSDIETGKVFYDKLTFIYLEMPKFTKTANELTTNFDKWLYAIRNLNSLDKIPTPIRNALFEKFFAMAEIANLAPEELSQYEDSLKVYRDLNNSLDTAREKGKIEGKLEAAKNALSLGLDLDSVAKISGLSLEEIKKIGEK